MAQIMSYMGEENDSLSESEIKNALSVMQDDNQVMLSDGTVFLI